MLVRLGRVASAALVLSAGVAACSLLTDLDGYTGGGDAGASLDAGGEGAAGDAGSADAADAAPATDAPASDADASGGCSSNAGPAPLRVGAFCIDSTEVTRAQWAAFLAAGVSLGTLGPACAGKASWGMGNVTELPPNAPATYVDWCDAEGYCRWAGKRLCGKVGGGASPPAAFSTVADEWYTACSRGGTRSYPYGNAFVTGTCATAENAAGNFIPVGSLPACVGGYDGLFDMSGNAREWSNNCDSDGGCMPRGGASDEVDTLVACSSEYATGRVDRSYTSLHTGFRCCSD